MSYDFLSCNYTVVERTLTFPLNSTVNVTKIVNVSQLNTSLQDCITNRLVWAVGNDLIAQLLIVAFFGVFVMMQDTRLDVKIAVMFPIILIVFWGSWLVPLLLVVGGALLLWNVWLKVNNR